MTAEPIHSLNPRLFAPAIIEPDPSVGRQLPYSPSHPEVRTYRANAAATVPNWLSGVVVVAPGSGVVVVAPGSGVVVVAPGSGVVVVAPGSGVVVVAPGSGVVVVAPGSGVVVVAPVGPDGEVPDAVPGEAGVVVGAAALEDARGAAEDHRTDGDVEVAGEPD